MKSRLSILSIILMLSIPKLLGQAAQNSVMHSEREAAISNASNLSQPVLSMRLLIPGLDTDSQSNVIVTVSDFFGQGQACPMKYTNVLSNTNLFTLSERETIAETFVKYKNVTTNTGPPGTELVKVYRTNHVTKIRGRTFGAEDCVAFFQYTNSEAQEELTFGAGLLAKFRTKSNDGYNVYIGRSGNGSVLQFMNVKQNLINGVFTTFDDNYPQGTNWDFRLANFGNSRLYEFRQYTNGMVLEAIS